ncbi:MAG: AAA family ATPase [Burkholderiales bacterium]|nr:AAA family ATPase [Burkholderiales bacterium]
MLTRIRIRNFKRLEKVDIELGSTVVFVGPNNSGKTTALQAIALWWFGLSNWVSKKGATSRARERTGATMNRRDLLALPVPSANLLWRDLHVRDTKRIEGKQQTTNVLIEITVEGLLNSEPWSSTLEFDYANPESLYCRPAGDLDDEARGLLARVSRAVRVAYLPPMSGLAPREFKAERGQINVLIGEGQTAQVLRNLCWSVFDGPDKSVWTAVVDEIRILFGVVLQDPRYIAERSEVEMSYIAESSSRVELDLSASGRGMQQTLLLLTYLHANPGATILLDEPDAHLEVLRQRQTYNVISRLATSQRCQIIAATHSEVVLNEAAGKHTVIAFIGSPHRLNDQGSQLKKALLSIGFEHYLQADLTGWVLYLEGSTDLAILRTFAQQLNHPALQALERPYVDYINSNTPPSARERFWGLREAKPELLGLAIFDRLENPMALQADASALTELCWTRRELENYLCTPDALIAWAASIAGDTPDDLFVAEERTRLSSVMRAAIAETESARATLRRPSMWSTDVKASDDVLDGLFQLFLDKADLPRATMYKKDYYRLAEFVPVASIDNEIVDKLDAISKVAASAKPRKG